MRTAAIPDYRLGKSKRSTRVLITLGLIGLLLGMGSSLLVTVAKTGLSSHSVREYYLGRDPFDSTTTSSDSIIPAEPRPFMEMAEITHLHLLGGSMLLFLLCHLISVCDVKDGLRSLLYVTSFTSFIVTFTLPWLIVYISPWFAALFAPAVFVLLLSLVVLTIVPLREMWGASDGI